MSGEERFGEWHALVIERQDANADEPELEWNVRHMASCPQEQYLHGPEYVCSLAKEITNAGYEAFEEPGDPLGPGRYRVRTWARSSNVPGYPTEWDAGVEVELLCPLCSHPAEVHDAAPDGRRPCRSVGHPDGVPCAECRRLVSAERHGELMGVRDGGLPFDAAWSAYTAVYDNARQAFGDSWQSFFTDIHQSALASALIAYQEAQQ